MTTDIFHLSPPVRVPRLMPALFAAALILMTGCEHYLQVDPPQTSLTRQHISAGFQTASSVLDGIYARMISSNQGFASGGQRSITLLAGLSADEFDAFSDTYLPFQSNQLEPSNGFISAYLWSEPYQYIFTVNSLIESMAQSQLTAAERDQILGEAKFVRAFCYFYLTALFGDVPLHLSSDYRTNSQAVRTAQSLVYDQIASDLTDARELMSSSAGPVWKKTRPGYRAATALLARTYLYSGKYGPAESLSTELIEDGSGLKLETDLNRVFLSESTEAVWQLRPVVPNINTHEGNTFILAGRPARSALSQNMWEAFEDQDQRRKVWISAVTVSGDTYRFPFKYRIAQGTSLQEFSIVLRLAEQYLIRAEIRARRNELTSAISDLAKIRSRAGLTTAHLTTRKQVLDLVFRERQRELFAEWGHRWFDVNRALDPDSVFSSKPANLWKRTDVLYPIPFSETDNNSHITQNPGY